MSKRKIDSRALLPVALTVMAATILIPCPRAASQDAAKVPSGSVAGTALPPASEANPVSDEENLSREEKIQKAKQYYETGEQYLQEGNYTAADEFLKKAQALLGGLPTDVILDEMRQQPSPQNETQEKDTWPAKKAWRLSAQGKSREAIASYVQAIEEEPTNADLYYNLGVELIKTGQFHKAFFAFQEVVKLRPLDKDAFYNMGVLFENYLNDKGKAVEYYQKYLKLAPKSEDSLTVKNWINEIRRTSGVK